MVGGLGFDSRTGAGGLVVFHHGGFQGLASAYLFGGLFVVQADVVANQEQCDGEEKANQDLGWEAHCSSFCIGRECNAAACRPFAGVDLTK